MARVRAFRKLMPPEILSDVMPFLRRMQDNVADSLAFLTEFPLLDWTWKRDVVLVSGATNPVAHGLTRPWRGYIVTRAGAAATIYAPAAQSLPERFVELVPSANVTVDLIMF